MSWLFALAYTCSGVAGLIYEVIWTRLLTLYIGHTTAAASAVVAAFLGGLAVGAAAGGAVASRISRRQSLYGYVGLELFVGLAALMLPFELSALTPLLAWAYQDGAPGLLFPIIRLLVCLLMIFLPAAALGATFPMAIRWFASESPNPARPTSVLYALNTVGAAVGALLAGFVLIPSIGLSGATYLGVGGSALAALSVLFLARLDGRRGDTPPVSASAAKRKGPRRPAFRRAPAEDEIVYSPRLRRLAVGILGVSGFASLMHEIVWTRILSLVLGPTIYAFAATLAAVIAGVACGSALGSWLVGRGNRGRQHAVIYLAFALAAAALTVSVTSSLAGQEIPRLVARQMASASQLFDQLFQQGALLTTALILPSAICLGATFPLTLAIVGESSPRVAGRFAIVYAVNTLGAVTGSLAAGFLVIPWLGLQGTLYLVSGCLIAAALAVVLVASLPRIPRIAGMVMTAAAALALVVSPPWDRELLASGAYLYAPFVPKDLDLETLLKAGTLLYYREGASSTVSVKRLTGTTTLAVDGKVDASNRGDMLTQKLIAHLPLLLHDQPRDVAIVGLGSGATAGAALRHPIARADVIEISPEVVEASRFFEAENHRALEDPRTHLIVGDGRSHLLLSARQYDVIISEPSNPWIAGVAALFTQEFFQAARARLAPNGIICQWANAYNISNADLRAIVATFRSVFPDGMMFLVGADDVLLVGSTGPLEPRLPNIAAHWHRPGVAEDLASVSTLEPFSLLSLYAGGPRELERYAQGAAVLTDDRMTLEFSAPHELHNRSAGENGATVTALLGQDEGPEAVRAARAAATVVQWRNRAAMMARADAVGNAYDDYVHALTLDPGDASTLAGLVRTAILTSRSADALSWVKSLTAGRAPSAEVLVAISKLLASTGEPADALDSALQASRLTPVAPAALEQLASLHADAGDLAKLNAVVEMLTQAAPARPATPYYAAVAAFLDGRPADAVARAQQAVALDRNYAPVYDLLGAAYTRLGQAAQAQEAFRTSLTFDAHDSTAYTNLGLLELASGNRAAAAKLFAEALWLAPQSHAAREGLAQAQ